MNINKCTAEVSAELISVAYVIYSKKNKTPPSLHKQALPCVGTAS